MGRYTPCTLVSADAAPIGPPLYTVPSSPTIPTIGSPGVSAPTTTSPGRTAARPDGPAPTWTRPTDAWFCGVSQVAKPAGLASAEPGGAAPGGPPTAARSL